MDILSNVLCAVIGSSLTLVGVIYKDRSNARQLKINNRRQAINEYLSEAGQLLGHTGMNSRYTAAFTKASVYFDENQIQLATRFETELRSNNKENARKILINLTDSLKQFFNEL